ncbi:MAG: hypothetical protein M3R72_12000, partial [Bacteroidota bacterium]|nr:hypothetical protein [Bacteroidota bacterium]
LRPGKKYFLTNGKWNAIILSVIFILYVLVTFLSPHNPIYISLPSYILGVLVLITKRRLKKIKPASMEGM